MIQKSAGMAFKACLGGRWKIDESMFDWKHKYVLGQTLKSFDWNALALELRRKDVFFKCPCVFSKVII